MMRASLPAVSSFRRGRDQAAATGVGGLETIRYDHDREFLDEIYEPIVRWNNWWFEQNDSNADGLCEYQHPYSSGLDDSPLWDDGMPVEAPDLNTYLCLQQEALSKIARVIGEDRDVDLWADRADAMADRLTVGCGTNRRACFWRAGRRPARASRCVRLSISFPLMTGRLPSNILQRLIAHLTDERESGRVIQCPQSR